MSGPTDWILRYIKTTFTFYLYFREAQLGFKKGRGTADGALGFVDPKKACDTVPREVVVVTQGWMGVPEAEVRMGMHKKTTARAVVGEGASEKFEVKIGLRQGSMLSPLLFIAVLDLISRMTVMKDAMKKCLYADDLALVANGKQELQETPGAWNGLFSRHGLDISLEKTEVLHVGHQTEDGKTGREVRRRVQAGTNAWSVVDGVMADQRISKRLKGKVMSTFVTPACPYGTETLALTELQQQRLKVCEKNWVRKIGRVTRADRRTIVELREETGVQRSLTGRLVRSRLQWAGHVERMADDILSNYRRERQSYARKAG